MVEMNRLKVFVGYFTHFFQPFHYNAQHQIIPQREMEFLPFVVNCSTRNSILKQSGTMPIFFVFFLQKKSHVHK
ncbi:hypothetical protein TNCT_736821 [Trichonephila clavata]|uniref:Uncharacterized protein n=1 Tax=Trichonephila clavata TaxID=2740835 RepID=A0A8X6HYP1_TRICU|nr:hypothetical protein TNCT_736821 [Trichonephila clavata]